MYGIFSERHELDVGLSEGYSHYSRANSVSHSSNADGYSLGSSRADNSYPHYSLAHKVSVLFSSFSFHFFFRLFLLFFPFCVTP